LKAISPGRRNLLVHHTSNRQSWILPSQIEELARQNRVGVMQNLILSDLSMSGKGSISL